MKQLLSCGAVLLLALSLSACCNCDDSAEEATLEEAMPDPEEATGDTEEQLLEEQREEGGQEAVEVDEHGEAAPTGPCPKGEVCEDGCSCVCTFDDQGRVTRKETDRGSDGSIEAVEAHYYTEQGYLDRSEEDGSLWTKGARVDGTADTVWVYTYDDAGNRLTHEVYDAKGKLTTTCRYKTCPPPHETNLCYTALKCK
jgi:hypothetical protein